MVSREAPTEGDYMWQWYSLDGHALNISMFIMFSSAVLFKGQKL